MAYPWTFNGQTMSILLGGVTNEQAASVTVRQVPYSGPPGAYIVSSGGPGPETIGFSVQFDNLADFETFRSGLIGTTPAELNWMLGVVPFAYLKSMHLKTVNATADLPVEADAQFVVKTQASSTGDPAYDSSALWSFTPTGGSPATLTIQGASTLTDDQNADVTTRQLPGSGSGPSWYVDHGAAGVVTIHLSLAFDTAADFLNFRAALLNAAGALVYPGGSVTQALLSKMSVRKVYPQQVHPTPVDPADFIYPVLATADFLVVQP